MKSLIRSVNSVKSLSCALLCVFLVSVPVGTSLVLLTKGVFIATQLNLTSSCVVSL